MANLDKLAAAGAASRSLPSAEGRHEWTWNSGAVGLEDALKHMIPHVLSACEIAIYAVRNRLAHVGADGLGTGPVPGYEANAGCARSRAASCQSAETSRIKPASSVPDLNPTPI